MSYRYNYMKRGKLQKKGEMVRETKRKREGIESKKRGKGKDEKHERERKGKR